MRRFFARAPKWFGGLWAKKEFFAVAVRRSRSCGGKKVKRLAAVLLGLVMVSGLTGCSKPPTGEMQAAESAVAAAKSEGSDMYASEDFNKLNEAMAAAQEEMKTQDSKIFKNYEKASTMLAEVKAEAETVKIKATAEKGRQKQQAESDLAKADAAVAEARSLVEQAPSGKGSEADIMAMKSDVAGLEAALSEIQPMLAAAKYNEVSSRSAAVSEKAGAISEEVKAAIAKMEEIAQLTAATKKKKK
jgi:hypothetical protein